MDVSGAGTAAADQRGTDAPVAGGVGGDFDRFYRGEWARAVRLASLLTQDSSVAEEVAQDAFTRVMDRWSTLREPGAYLHRCVVNACRGYHRHRAVVDRKLVVLAHAEESVEGLEELADVVARLPFRQRAVVVLRYWCGLSEREIAEALGCRPGTVKSLSSRALARLHKEVSQ